MLDLEFKKMKSRGSEQFKHLTLDSSVTKDDAIKMYRIITGACQQGTNQFLQSIKKFKKTYTVREIIALTEGHYGAEVFRRYFEDKE